VGWFASTSTIAKYYKPACVLLQCAAVLETGHSCSQWCFSS